MATRHSHKSRSKKHSSSSNMNNTTVDYEKLSRFSGNTGNVGLGATGPISLYSQQQQQQQQSLPSAPFYSPTAINNNTMPIYAWGTQSQIGPITVQQQPYYTYNGSASASAAGLINGYSYNHGQNQYQITPPHSPNTNNQYYNNNRYNQSNSLSNLEQYVHRQQLIQQSQYMANTANAPINRLPSPNSNAAARRKARLAAAGLLDNIDNSSINNPHSALSVLDSIDDDDTISISSRVADATTEAAIQSAAASSQLWIQQQQQQQQQQQRQSNNSNNSISPTNITSTDIHCHLCNQLFHTVNNQPINSGNNFIASLTDLVNSRIPRLLLCGHTYCQCCLQGLIEKQFTAVDNTNKNINIVNNNKNNNNNNAIQSLDNPLIQNPQFYCPHNCVSTPLTSGGILGLLLNEPLMNLITFLQQRGIISNIQTAATIPISIDDNILNSTSIVNNQLYNSTSTISSIIQCEQCNLELAVVYCKICKIDFCSNCCRLAHNSKAYSKHANTGGFCSIQDKPLNSNNNNNNNNTTVLSYCNIHNDQILNLYCINCSIPVCTHCISIPFNGTHSDTKFHTIELLSNLANNSKLSLNSILNELSQRNDKLIELNSNSNNSIINDNKLIHSIEKQLIDEFELIRLSINKSINDRELELKSKLLLLSNNRLSILNNNRKSIVELLAEIQAIQYQGLTVLNKSNNNNANNTVINSIDLINTITAAKKILNNTNKINNNNTNTTTVNTNTNSHQLIVPLSTINFRSNLNDIIPITINNIINYGNLISAVPTVPIIDNITIKGNSIVINWNNKSNQDIIEYYIEVCERPRLINNNNNNNNANSNHKFNNSTTNNTINNNNSIASNNSIINSDELINLSILDRLALTDNNNNKSIESINFTAANSGVLSTDLFTRIATVSASTINNTNTINTTATINNPLLSFTAINLLPILSYQYRLCAKNQLGLSEYTYTKQLLLSITELLYSNDMDNNGLIYYIGTEGLISNSFNNPNLNGLIEISVSSILTGESSSLTSRRAATFSTLNRPFSSIKFDLSKSIKYKLLLTSYTLVNCNKPSLALHTLRNWRLSGSNNDIDWIIIRDHIHDNTLSNTVNSTATFTVDSKIPFRYFRLIQTDINAAADQYLVLGGIELYGYLSKE